MRSRAKPWFSVRRPTTSQAATTTGDSLRLWHPDGAGRLRGQIYPIWSGNFNSAILSTVPFRGHFCPSFISRWSLPMGHESSIATWGRSRYAEATSGAVSFTVTFDRPIDPPSLNGYTTIPTFTPADVLVYYHDTTNGDPLVPLQVTSVTPIAASGVGPENRFGYTQFRVTFDPLPSGANPATYNYTGTYSYMILPDDGSGTPISSPIRSFVNSPVDQPVIGPVSSTNVPLPVPTFRDWRVGNQRRHHDVDDHDQQLKLHQRECHGNHRQPDT